MDHHDHHINPSRLRFFSHKICWSKVKSAICPWDSSEEKGCAWCLWQKVISANNRATFVLHEKKKREIRQNLQYMNIHAISRDVFFKKMFFVEKNGKCYKEWCNFPLSKPARIVTIFLHLALGKLTSPEKQWGCRSRSSPLCCLWLWTVCCLTILLASKDEGS